MEGKKLFGFPFIPMITNMRVRVLYTETETAIMLEWIDKKPDKGDDDFPPDAIRLQFPIRIPGKTTEPNINSRVNKNLVNLWYWTSSDNKASELNATGPREYHINAQENNNLTAFSTYKDGLYRVIIKRAINTKDENDITFLFDKHIPFTIVAYDGQHNEEGNRGAISTVHYFILKSPTS
jgi:DMSO reductase family type II enzyme heme b subunit